MMTVLRSFFFILFFGILLLFSAAAQQTKSVTISLSSITNSKNGLMINQSILNTLSTGQSKAVQDMEIMYTISYSVRQNNADKSIWLRLHRIEITGDQVYRSFVFGPTLSPDIFIGQKMLPSQPSEAFRLNFAPGLSEQRLGFSDELAINPSDLVNITGISFSEEARDRINQRVSVINEYWALSNLADSLVRQSETAENTLTSGPSPAFVFKDYLRRVLLLMDSVLSNETLDLSTSDPAEMLLKKERLQRLHTRFKTITKSLMNGFEADEQFINRLAAAYTDFQIRTIKRSLRTDYKDSDLLVKSARMQPDTELKQQIHLFGNHGSAIAGRLFTTMIGKADSLIAQDDYTNAISFYEDALSFIKMFNLTYDIKAVQERLDTARLGMLQSHLRIAARAVETGNVQLANTYKAKSSSFANSQFTDEHIPKISEQPSVLIQTYLRKGNQMLDSRRYAEAVQLFESARSAAQNYFNTGYNEQIIQGLFAAHRFIYLDLVQQAEQLYIDGKRPEADRRLQQALNYRADHPDFLRTSMEAVHMQNRINSGKQNITAAASGFADSFSVEQLSFSGFGAESRGQLMSIADVKKQIFSELPKVQLKAWANELDEAWLLYGQLAELRDSYSLQKESDVVAAFNELDKRMIERICLNHKFRYDDLIEQSKKMIQQKDLTKLEEALNEAISIVVNNQGCLLSDEEARYMAGQYERLFLYQRAYTEVMNLLVNRGIYFAIPAYEKLDETIEMYQLSSFGVKHQPLNEFIRNQNNSSLTLQTLRYYIDEINVDRLTLYLKLLSNQQFNFDEAVDLFEKSAMLLAIAENASEDKPFEAFVRSLAAGDRRFDYLRKQFERSKKQLSRNR